MHVVVETDRLILRHFTMADVEGLLALDNDPLVRRFVEDGEEINEQYAIDCIHAWMQGYKQSDLFGFFAADRSDTGEFVGWFHLRPAPDVPEDEPELGYRLTSRSWGRGFATEGSQALIDLGFMSGTVQRVVAETMVVHGASRRVMEKVGMTLVRTFHAEWPVSIPGDQHGDVEYAITRAEWVSTKDTRSDAT